MTGAIPISIGDTVENGKPPGAGNIASPGAKQRYTFAGIACPHTIEIAGCEDGTGTDGFVVTAVP